METKTNDEKKKKAQIGTTGDVALLSPKVQKLTKHQSPTHESKPANANSSNTEEPPLEIWLKEDGDQCNIPSSFLS
jgi:hypothetical protein